MMMAIYNGYGERGFLDEAVARSIESAAEV
jgi:hypothetical protein